MHTCAARALTRQRKSLLQAASWLLHAAGLAKCKQEIRAQHGETRTHKTHQSPSGSPIYDRQVQRDRCRVASDRCRE